MPARTCILVSACPNPYRKANLTLTYAVTSAKDTSGQVDPTINRSPNPNPNPNPNLNPNANPNRDPYRNP